MKSCVDDFLVQMNVSQVRDFPIHDFEIGRIGPLEPQSHVQVRVEELR